MDCRSAANSARLSSRAAGGDRRQLNILLIQDLDGVCMPLVRDPLTRVLPRDYIEAVSRVGHRFRVLTNGEHSGGAV